MGGLFILPLPFTFLTLSLMLKLFRIQGVIVYAVSYEAALKKIILFNL